MKIRNYIKDKFVYFILWFLMIMVINFFLIMFKAANSLIIIITMTELVFMTGIYSYEYFKKKFF